MGGLISESYREQNAKLHRSNDHYGNGGSKWALRTVSIMRRGEYESILDYGCGKGSLKKSLTAWNVREYDPAIVGKHNAEPADLVVCTDVLEHIEPDYVDSVLNHLHSVTKKHLLFCISTRPARASVLPDGRNPHLSLHDAEWWKEKLSQKFTIIEWKVVKDECFGEALPINEVPPIQTISALSEDDRNANMRINSLRVSKRLQSDCVLPHGRTAILVCAGPSLNMTWPTILRQAGDIFTVSVAHKVLVEKGIIPFAHIDCDPRPHKSRQIGKPHKDIRYWLASCIDPEYLDKLEGFDVTLWHLHNGPETEKFFFADPVFKSGEWLAVGGGSVGLRAISLLYSQGYRHFSIYGMDCSFTENNQRHATEHLGKNNHAVIRVRCGERWFNSSLSLIDYARQFADDMRLWPGTTFEMHGDGLLQEMAKQSNRETTS